MPSASRASAPSRSICVRCNTGARPANSTNGNNASAIGQAMIAKLTSTADGTSSATSAGATVWAKKYSIVSISWLASAIKSPERRRTR